MRVSTPILVGLALVMGAATASADPADLSNGVFIAHAPSTLQYSSDPPGGSWCAAYSACAIDSCSEQDNEIDSQGMAVWYVLCAWTESKEWCGTEFGLGGYDDEAFVIEAHGPCFPSAGLTIPTSGWPGPGEGIALTTTDSTWTGNFRPVYWFAGYTYAEDVIPLSPDPANGFGGWSECEDQEEFEAGAFGGIGLLTDGVYACPEEEQGGDSAGGETDADTAGGGEFEEDGSVLDSEEPDRLSNGVLLVHHPIGLQYSAGADYCAYAADSLSFPDCWEDVNPTVPVDSAASVWFVIAAWQEAKEFERIDFGFGSFDEQAYGFLDYGPCFPSEGQETSDAGWPGPLKGTSVTISTAPWQGEFVPIYYFTGYAYSEAEIAIQGRQPGALAKVTNGVDQEYEVRASRCGILGIGRSGVAPCPSMSLTQEVLVRFVPAGIELAPGTSHATAAGVTASSAGFDSLLSEFSVRHIAKSSPGAVRDTVGFTCRSGQTVHLTDVTDHYRLLVGDSLQALALAASLDSDPSVLQATVDVLEADLCLVWPDEFSIAGHNHWHLHNDRWLDPETSCTDDIDIDAPQAWDITQGSSTVRIGVLDSPIFDSHEDLQSGRITRRDDGTYPVDHHGTMAAGVIASTPNNGLGAVGVDWDAEIYGYDTNRAMQSRPVNTEWIADRVEEAISDGCAILNCSWIVDGPEAVDPPEEGFQYAFVDAYKANVLVVAAMGNTEHQTVYPANWDHGILGVGNVMCNGEPGATNIASTHIDVVAPGQNLYLPCHSNGTLDCPGNDYYTVDGTSCAAPVVTGIASLLLAYSDEHQLDLCNDDLAALIRLGAEDLWNPGWDIRTGWGIVNAWNSLMILETNEPEEPHFVLLADAGFDSEEDVGGPVEYHLWRVPEWSQELPFSGNLVLQRVEVKKLVSLGGVEPGTAVVWGRGFHTRGLGDFESELGDPGTLWGYGHCEPVGTAVDGSWWFRTWVYSYNEGERWFPCPPGEVLWSYGVCSTPSFSSVGEEHGGLTAGLQSGLQIGTGSPLVGGVVFNLRLPGPGRVRASVFDVQGRQVNVVAEEEFQAGAVELAWDHRDDGGAPVGSGVYVVRVESPYGIATRRFIVVH